MASIKKDRNKYNQKQKDKHQYAYKQSQNLEYEYTCISCLHPSPKLYRQYSTAHNIKLQQCAHCTIKDVGVDTYIEYELLLVCMDLLLYRKRAYRHLLFNRSFCDYRQGTGSGDGDNDDAENNDNADNGNGGTDDKKGEEHQHIHERQKSFFTFICTTSTKDGKNKFSSNVAIYIVMVVLLKTILKLQGLTVGVEEVEGAAENQNYYDDDYDYENNHNACYYYYPMDKIIFSTASMRILRRLSSFEISESEHYCYTFLPIFTVLSMLSILEYAILYFGTLISTKFAARHIAQLHQSQQQFGLRQRSALRSIVIARDIYLAVFLPQFFHIVTLLVHIYESSSTVQFIGSGFTCSIMYMAVHSVVERIVVRLTSTNAISVIPANTTSYSEADITTASATTNDTAGVADTYTATAVGSKMDQFILSLSRIIPGWPLLFGLFLKFIIPQLVFMALFHWSASPLETVSAGSETLLG